MSSKTLLSSLLTLGMALPLAAQEAWDVQVDAHTHIQVSPETVRALAWERERDQWFPPSPEWKERQKQPVPAVEATPQIRITSPSPAAESTAPPSSAPNPPAATAAPPSVSNTTLAEKPRRAPAQPFDSIFPSGGEFMGLTIGVPDSTPVYPLTRALWDACPDLADGNGIRVNGWLNASYNLSTSKDSNVPAAYNVAPNRPVVNQFVLRMERQPDTVQTDHADWGFRISSLYGIDYRYTTTQGIFSNQLLGSNQLYGFDPVEAYGMVYVPDVAEGMLIKFGRIISPADIEAQLAPENYMMSHSLMYTYDIYTETGVFAGIKLDDNWTVMLGVHAGGDVAPWNQAANPSGLCELRWVSDDNKDSLHFGVSSINNGKFKGGHDNIQETTLNWTHVFNNDIHTATEFYYLYSYDAFAGGTFNNGPFRFGGGGGAGAFLPGLSTAFGGVNYLEFKLSDQNYLSIRNGFLHDPRGWRTGFPTTYSDHTIGITHHFSELFTVRPELRYEHAYSAAPYDNGTKSSQFMFGFDAILRY